MKRLVNSPKYTINSSSSSSYKATIMMLMDCETQPFSTYTKLTNLQDLYRNYYTESNNISYKLFIRVSPSSLPRASAMSLAY